jgi:hypothetical protein
MNLAHRTCVGFVRDVLLIEEPVAILIGIGSIMVLIGYPIKAFETLVNSPCALNTT